jgi:hypothetical protein
MEQDKNSQLRVAEILRSFDRKECFEKAELLANSEHKSSSLNLRNLGLKATEVLELAFVLKDIENKGGSTIDSISFSYNSSLEDKGAVTLIKSLPISIRELGFVNCGIGENGGQELLNWMRNAPSLKMICAEQNLFSDKLKSNFIKFSVENPQIIVVV